MILGTLYLGQLSNRRHLMDSLNSLFNQANATAGKYLSDEEIAAMDAELAAINADIEDLITDAEREAIAADADANR